MFADLIQLLRIAANTVLFLVLTTFWAAGDALTINCRYKMHDYESDHHEPFLGKTYSCMDATFSPSCDSSPNIVGVSKNHMPGKTNEDVQMFVITTNQIIPRLPKNLDKFFPNLVAFSLPFIGLEEITSEDLRFPKLRFLYLGHNNLKSLDGDLFKYNPMLEFVAFDWNRVANVGSGLLDSLYKLRIIYVNRNVCSTIVYSPGKTNHVNDAKKELKEKCPPGPKTPPNLNEDNFSIDSVSEDCLKKFYFGAEKSKGEKQIESSGESEGNEAGIEVDKSENTSEKSEAGNEVDNNENASLFLNGNAIMVMNDST